MTPPNTTGAQALSDEQIADVIQIVRNIFGGQSGSSNAAHWADMNARANKSIREALAGREQAGAVAMIPMQADDGRKGWYVQTDDFYLDIEQDADGKWSAFFRHTYGGEAFVDQAALAAPSAAVASRDLDDADMDAVVTAIAALNNGEIGFHAFCDRIVALSAPAIAAREQDASPSLSDRYMRHEITWNEYTELAEKETEAEDRAEFATLTSREGASAETAPSPEGILRKDEAHQLALIARKYGAPAVGREGLMAAMRDAYLLGLQGRVPEQSAKGLTMGGEVDHG